MANIYLICNNDGEVKSMIKSGQEPEDFKIDYKGTSSGKKFMVITLYEKDREDIISLNKRG